MRILRLTVGLNVSSPKKFFGGLWGLKRKNIILLKFTSYFIKQAVSELLHINWNYLRLLILTIFFRINDKHNDVQKKKFKVIFEVINSKITKNHYTKNKWTFLEIYNKIKKFHLLILKRNQILAKLTFWPIVLGPFPPRGPFDLCWGRDWWPSGWASLPVWRRPWCLIDSHPQQLSVPFHPIKIKAIRY